MINDYRNEKKRNEKKIRDKNKKKIINKIHLEVMENDSIGRFKQRGHFVIFTYYT